MTVTHLDLPIRPPALLRFLEVEAPAVVRTHPTRDLRLLLLPTRVDPVAVTREDVVVDRTAVRPLVLPTRVTVGVVRGPHPLERDVTGDLDLDLNLILPFQKKSLTRVRDETIKQNLTNERRLLTRNVPNHHPDPENARQGGDLDRHPPVVAAAEVLPDPHHLIKRKGRKVRMWAVIPIPTRTRRVDQAEVDRDRPVVAPPVARHGHPVVVDLRLLEKTMLEPKVGPMSPIREKYPAIARAAKDRVLDQVVGEEEGNEIVPGRARRPVVVGAAVAEAVPAVEVVNVCLKALNMQLRLNPCS